MNKEILAKFKTARECAEEWAFHKGEYKFIVPKAE